MLVDGWLNASPVPSDSFTATYTEFSSQPHEAHASIPHFYFLMKKLSKKALDILIGKIATANKR